MNITGICKWGLPALGLAALLGSLPNGVWAQDSAAPVPGVVTTTGDALRLFKLPLKDATPAFIIGKLSRVYYFGAHPAGPGSSGFGATPSSNGGFSGGGFSGNAMGFNGGGNPFGSASQAATTLRLAPSPIRLDGVRFLIDNERDNSLVVEATPEGFNALRAIVSALDVPVTARAKSSGKPVARIAP